MWEPGRRRSSRSGDASSSPRDVSPLQTTRRRLSQQLSHASSHRRRSAGESAVYDVPDSYRNLEDAQADAPVQNLDESPMRRYSSRENRFAGAANSPSPSQEARQRRRSSAARRSVYDVPDNWTNLDEVAASSPVENFHESPLYRHRSLEETRSRDQDWKKGERQRRASLAAGEPAGLPTEQAAPEQEKQEGEEEAGVVTVSRLVTQIYTLSYLIFFSLLGTLARIGMVALTTYPGTPVIFNTVWANFGGCLVMGFLAEDRMLFRDELGEPKYDNAITQAKRERKDEENGSGSDQGGVNLAAAKKQHLTMKKTIPLYIGLATGFCGSFTSFSSFMRDVFLALSNDMVTPGVADLPASRNGGYSFMALLAVIITTVCLSVSALYIGAHLAIASEPFTPSIPYTVTRRILDNMAVALGLGCWLGAIFLSIFPPHDFWRGRATFALAFAPLGCLARFYLALHLNGKLASFPLGTFAANILGTAVLGMAWDIAHAPIGGVVGCQVLQGIDDGFCGCLTTISTWVAELTSLRRWHGYVYGFASVAVALAFMVVIMGGLRWTDGFSALMCST